MSNEKVILISKPTITVMKNWHSLVFLLLSIIVSCLSSEFPFMNASLPWQVRVDDIVGRLSIEEIQSLLADGTCTPAIPRLGIGEYSWWTNCERGDVGQNATAFPQSIGLGASFDTDLVYRVAEASSIEVRAYYNFFIKTGTPMGIHRGLTCFGPNIDLFRDPRWGRGAVLERDWRAYFLPAFRRCAEAGAYGFVCSHNSINGVPACVNKKLLTDILRAEWNFTGYVASEVNELFGIINNHHYMNNTVDVAAACLKAGCNQEVHGGDKGVYDSIIDAIKQGKLTEDYVREQIKPLLYTRLRLGEFDPPEMNPYNLLDKDNVVLSAYHRQLALEAAVKSFVLLKNNQLLPIKKTFDRIAVVGPMANNSEQIFGDYAPSTDPHFITTALSGLMRLANVAQYAAGCSTTFCNNYVKEEVIKALDEVDAVFVCLGTGQSVESEGNDRHNISLPGSQLQLLQDVTNNTNKPVVLLLFTGGPVNIEWAVQNQKIVAIMECFLPAQSAGDAILMSLTATGEWAVPAARLPYTWPMSDLQIPPMTNYSMSERTYRHFTGDPTFPFGYGLSYTTFSYSNLICPTSVQAGKGLQCQVTVANTGQYTADEVSQVYISWQNTSLPVPRLQLVGFSRRNVRIRTSIIYELTVDDKNMAVWTGDKGWVVLPGKMNIYVGGQQPNQKRSVASNVVDAVFEIIGTKVLGKY